MNQTSTYLLALVLLMGAGGCKSGQPAGGGGGSGGGAATAASGPAVDTTHVKDLRRGETKKDQARQWFGAPHKTEQVDAIERWTYTWKIGAAGNALVLDFDAGGGLSDFAQASDFDSARVKDVQRGSTKDQVLQLFGQAPRVEQAGAVERWTYTGKAGTKTKAFVVDFDAQGLVCDQAYVEQ